MFCEMKRKHREWAREATAKFCFSAMADLENLAWDNRV